MEKLDMIENQAFSSLNLQQGTLSNDDNDNNNNVKKQLALWAKQLHVHHAF